MYRCFAGLLCLCLFLTTSVFAQQPTFKAKKISSSSFQELDQQFTAFQLFELQVNAIDEAVKAPIPQYQFQLELGSEHAWNLDLIPNELRAPNYQLKTSSEVFLPDEEIITFRGRIIGEDQSDVRLTIDKDFIYGYIRNGDEMVFIEPLWYFQKDAPKDQFVVYQPQDVRPRNMTCGAAEMEKREDDWVPENNVAQQQSSSTINCYEVELAMATDFSMFQKYGSVAAVEAHTLGVLNNVQGNYDDEFEDEIQFIVVTQFASDCNTCDPWTSSTSAGALLGSFRSWGNAGGFGASYDVAELWTNRNFDGPTIGIAFLNAICNSNRYHVIQDFSSNANLLRVVVAHEFGHNFSSPHDASGSGFIMAPSVNNTNTWSPASINFIDNYVNNRANLPNCLTSCASQLPPQADFEADITTGCDPLQVNFTDLSINAPSSWSWTFPGGTPATSNQPNPTVVYPTPGVYDVILQVVNAAGADVATKVNYIEVLGGPTADFDYFVSDFTVVFSNFSTNANSYVWDFGDGQTSFASDPIHTYQQDGTYAVILEATNDCGTTTFIQVIEIITQPLPNFEANPSTTGCAPFDVFFVDLSTANTTDWNWFFPGGTPSTSEAQFPAVNYATSGFYDVTLEVSNAAGTNTLTQSMYIQVFDGPVPAYTYATTGSTVDFTNTSTDALTYLWDFGDTNTSTQTNPTHTYANDGTYTVVLTAFNDCDTLSFEEMVTISNLPSAGATADVTAGCATLTVQFTDQSSANTLGWSWSFPGGNPLTSTDQNPVVTYSAAGTYDVLLTVNNASGTDMITLSNYISVDDVPAVGFNSSASGTTVDFTNTSSNATSYSWDFGDGNTSTDANPTHTYATDGVYTVLLTATNSCGSVTSTETVTIITPPNAGATADVTSGCVPLTVNFTDQSSSNATSWDWTFPGGTPSSSTAENPTITYNTAGTYNVELTVSNAAGTDMITLSNYISVDDVPSVGFSSSTSGTTVNFTNSSSNATSYSWDFGDGNSSTDANPSHTYATDGVYTVVLTATNNCGSVISTETVTIITPPNAGATADVTSGCAPLTVNFTDQSSSNATSWSWTFPGGTPSSSTAENPSITYNTAGVYNVELTVSNAAGTDMITLSNYITVDDVPSIGFSTSVSGSTVNFTNSSSNATSYSWDFGDGTSSTDLNPSHTYAMDGSYTVVLTATNNCGTVTTSDVVNIGTVPNAGATANITSGCAPLTVNFTDQSSSNTTAWSWTFPGGSPSSSTLENPTVTYNTAGTYDVMLTVNNATGMDMLTLTNYISVNDVPGVSFTSNTSGTTTNFTNTSTNATSYNWDFGDGNSSTNANPSHTYATDGVYTVVLTATNACGSVTSTETVTIVTVPNAGATADVTSGCAPLTVNFTDQSSSNATSWSWTFPGGTPSSSTAENPSVTYNTAGTYNVELTVSNAAGMDMITLSNYITINDVPSVGFSSTTTGTTVDFSNSSTNATSYNWDFGDGTNSTDTNPSHTYATDGVYTVVLTATNACGSTMTTETITIVTPPTAGFTADLTSGCAPLTVQFTDQSSSNATSWSWTFPGGTPSSSTMQNPTITYNTGGTYDVTLIVSNSAGMDLSTSVSYISVAPMPTPSFTIQQMDLTANFTNTSMNATSYLWDFGDGSTSTLENPSHDYLMEGTYTVTLTATNACGSMTTTTTVEITLGPLAGFSADVTSGCAPLTVQFSDQSSGGATGWDWTFPGGTPSSSTLQNPIIVYNTPGVYDVSLEISTSAGGNTLMQNSFIEVLAMPSSAFTSSSNGATVDFTNGSSNATSYLWDFGDGTTSTEANPSHTFPGDGTYTVILNATNDCGTVTSTETIIIVTAPVAGFTANDSEGCAPFTVSFVDASSSNATSWLWTFPGGTPATSTEQNPMITYNAAGDYSVTLEVANSAGSNSITQINFITVNVAPSADFSSTIMDNQVNFFNLSSGGTSYLWDFGDGNTSTEMNPDHIYNASGDYTVVLTVTNECGSVTSTQIVTITIVSLPSAGFTSNTTVGCLPLEVQFTDQSSDNVEGWKWTFDGGTPANSTMENPLVTYNTAGVYPVTLVVSNAAGADTITFMDYITVLGPPVAGFTYMATNFTVDFANMSTDATSYSWDFGDGSASNLENPSHTFPGPGTYTVTLTATNDCGPTTTTLIIVLEEGGVPPTSAFSGTPTSGCGPLTVQFSDLSAGNPTSWSWTFAGGIPATSTEQNPMVTYSQPGLYEVILEVTNALGSNSLTQSNYIEVLAQPQAGFTFVGDNSGGIQFTSTSTAATTYSWDFGDGNTSNLENPMHNYATSGVYTVVLTVTNECGTNTFTQTVDVTITGIEDLSFLESLELYPNPNNGEFVMILQGESREVLELKTINVLGQVVTSQTLSFPGYLRQEFDLSNQASGVYLLQLRSAGEVMYHKVIVE